VSAIHSNLRDEAGQRFAVERVDRVQQVEHFLLYRGIWQMLEFLDEVREMLPGVLKLLVRQSLLAHELLYPILV
jgi:hypothetical protein